MGIIIGIGENAADNGVGPGDLSGDVAIEVLSGHDGWRSVVRLSTSGSGASESPNANPIIIFMTHLCQISDGQYNERT